MRERICPYAKREGEPNETIRLMDLSLRQTDGRLHIPATPPPLTPPQVLVQHHPDVLHEITDALADMGLDVLKAGDTYHHTILFTAKSRTLYLLCLYLLCLHSQ